jgi:Domain of unknown function (DUF4303)
MKETEQALLGRLDVALEAALRNAVEEAQRVHAPERFYAYILYTSPLLEYAFLSCNSEEALATISSTEQRRGQLRWSPPDWKYHCEGKNSFAAVNEILGLILERQGYDEPGRRIRWDIFMAVLKRLDAEGVFSPASNRESVLLNVMWGDQDTRAHVESARELNPLQSYLRYARDQLANLKASKREIEGSRSMYKEQALARIRFTLARVEKDLAGEHSRKPNTAMGLSSSKAISTEESR